MASVVDSCLASGIKTELVVNTLDTVGGVDVLDKGDLPAGSTTLAGGDGRSSQEVFPDLKRRISSSTYITWSNVYLRGTISFRTSPQLSHGCPSSYGTSAR